MTKQKKLFTLIIAACLLLGLFCITASAETLNLPTLDEDGYVIDTTGTGWTYNNAAKMLIISDSLTITDAHNEFLSKLNDEIELLNYGIIDGATIDLELLNFGTIKNGIFYNEVNNKGAITGGTFDARVSNDTTINGDAVFFKDVYNYGKLIKGNFKGNIYNWSVIEGGVFSRYIANFPDCEIKGGTFTEDSDVENKGNAIISDGTYMGKVSNTYTGIIKGGEFYGTLKNNNPSTTSPTGATIHEIVITCYNISADDISVVAKATQLETVYLWSDGACELFSDRKIESVKFGGNTITANNDGRYELTIPQGYTDNKIELEVSGMASTIRVAHTQNEYDITVTATLEKDADGTVKFILGSESVTATVTEGIAKATFKGLKEGEYTVTIEHTEDSVYADSDTEYAFKVTKPIEKHEEIVENPPTFDAAGIYMAACIGALLFIVIIKSRKIFNR